jgi:hypothetical protein
MPKEETFLELKEGQKRIRVIKTYDATYAREVFQDVDSPAIRILADSLQLSNNYDEKDIPSPDSPDYNDFIWEELLDSAREDGQIRSFFVVAVDGYGETTATPFISPDWPTAESFAKGMGSGHVISA